MSNQSTLCAVHSVKETKEATSQDKHDFRFHSGIEALPDAALVLSPELVILAGNKKAQRLLGVRFPDNVGQHITELLTAPEFADYLAQDHFDTPLSVVSPLNDELQLEISVMAFGYERVILIARAIAKYHRLKRMRREFVANVSHELKTPLTVVRGYVEMIQETEHALDPHWQKVFGTIEGQVSRMERLVEQLLSLSKVENNRDDIDMDQVNMPFVIKNLVEDAKWLNQEKCHEIRANITDEFGVYGIETELKSACANLISNAIAYTPTQGVIDVSWQRNGDKMIFSVKDNGDGIKAEHVNRLTERFYRIDKSRSRDTGGSGLGLAIVKHVLLHHKAELVITSEWGKGSEFAIYFDEAVVL
ncbi:MAG: phosphate regulon sensor histidine kinase PhoR [Colwellia sp.]|nr:phosphate regulon sensor histidine kinase PhoR [Colwellia sp.]MCW8866735.1 phosphate regulon sensor histidine kinase PhoR [Colwellia sp.]